MKKIIIAIIITLMLSITIFYNMMIKARVGIIDGISGRVVYIDVMGQRYNYLIEK